MTARRSRWPWIAGIVLVAMVGGCVLSLALQAPTYRISRARTLHASPERIHRVITDVRQLAACCSPTRSEPAETSFSSTTQGVGAWVEWQARDRRVRATIEEVSPARVTTRFAVGEGSSLQTIELQAVDGGTQVTWTIEGDKSGFLQRALWPIVALDARVGGDIEEDLGRLEAAASGTPSGSGA